MAYRAKRTKRRSSTRSRKAKGSRRRRIGASPGSRRGRVMQVVGTLAGVAATRFVNMIPGIEKIDAKLVAVGLGVVGYFVPTFFKGSAKPFVESVGNGVMIGGGMTLLSDLGVLNGLPIVSGWKELGTVNGPASHRTVAKAASDNVMRPSTAQVMNSYYHRRQPDGR